MHSSSWQTISFLSFIAFAAILLTLPGGAEAADREIIGDWEIPPGTTHVIGETIDVRGNVIIQAGGVLKLEDCELAINCSDNGQFALEVLEGGRLEAYGSTIYGNRARFAIRWHDDVLVDGCQIHHFHGGYSGTRGLTIDGGTTSMKDTTVSDSNYHGMYVQSDLNLDNVTVEDVVNSNLYIYNYGPSADFNVNIANSRILGPQSGGYWAAGMYIFGSNYGVDIDVTVTDTDFVDCESGVSSSATGSLDLVVERCTFTDCDTGIGMSYSTTGGTYVFRDNDIDAGDIWGSRGITLTFRSDYQPTIDNNQIQNAWVAYQVNGRWGGGGGFSGSIGDLDVSGCTHGLLTDYNIQLTVHNSSFTDIGSIHETFIARNASTITIIDTVHNWGSGKVEHAESWIKAFLDIEVLGARWKGGDPIVTGFLVLENLTHYEVARFDLDDLRTQDVAAWEVDSQGKRTSQSLWPAIYIDEHGFRGDRFDIEDYTPRIFQLVDDSVPSLSIEAPDPGVGFNVTTVMASGTYDELGSGLDTIEYRLGDANWTPLTSWSQGEWTLPLTSLTDGEHNLALRPRDKVGNVGNEHEVSFLVDTTLPTIYVDQYPALISATSLVVTGSTEKLATLTFEGEEVPLDENGSFTIELALEEGRNVFHLTVVDRARNVYSENLVVVSDTIAPVLMVTNPRDDVWTNAHQVQVEGITEEAATLTVNGEQVMVLNGTFSRRVDLTEGDFTLTAVATDDAGNAASMSLELHVDWLPPEIVLVEPEEPEVYVRESSIYITGDVDDPTVEHVTINGLLLPLTNGRFVKQFTVLEGTTEFVVNATDLAGNPSSVKVVVIRDLTAPTYTSEMVPKGGELVYVDGDLYSTAPAVEVHLVLSEPSVITLGDGTVLPLTTEVRQRFDLQEGMNELEMYIVDVADNQGQTYRERVFVDTTAPTIEMYSPQPGARTEEDTVVIHGLTEEGSTLTINGESVNLMSDGEFRHVMALVDGRNEFTIKVVDAMGNNASTSLSVLREIPVTASGGTSTTSASVSGFIIGLIVGLVVAVAFFTVRQRGAVSGEGEEPTAVRRTFEPPEPPEETEGPPAKEGGGDWEEF